MEDVLTKGKELFSLIKLINRYYKNLWLKSTDTRKNRQRYHSNEIFENLMSWKENHITAFPANFSPCWYGFNETRCLSTANSEINPPLVKSGIDSNCKYFRTSATREGFKLKPEPQMEKNLFPINIANSFTDTMKKKEKMYQFFFLLCLNNIRAPALRQVCISNFQLFSVSVGYKNISCTNRAIKHWIYEQGSITTVKRQMFSEQITTCKVN